MLDGVSATFYACFCPADSLGCLGHQLRHAAMTVFPDPRPTIKTLMEWSADVTAGLVGASEVFIEERFVKMVAARPPRGEHANEIDLRDIPCGSLRCWALVSTLGRRAQPLVRVSELCSSLQLSPVAQAEIARVDAALLGSLMSRPRVAAGHPVGHRAGAGRTS